MNFLAHLFLSGENENILVGNFIADFVKGKRALESFDIKIRRGIELHRAIDLFTDTHAVVASSKDKLRPKYRHYAGVIVDVFYDHYLAKNWGLYANVRLEDFADRAYKTLQRNYNSLPVGVQQMLPYMVRGNWLVNYSRPEGIGRALTGMSRRTPYESKMDEALNDLIKFDDEFEQEFKIFFPELQVEVTRFLENS